MRPRRPASLPPGGALNTSPAPQPQTGASPKPATAWDASTQSTARAALSDGATQLGVVLSAGQVDALMAYLGLLHKWSQVYNLTAVRDPMEMVTLHLLDSLAVVPPLLRYLAATSSSAVEGGTLASTSAYASTPANTNASPSTHAESRPAYSATASMPPTRLLDVGSGAGLPGVVIAIACPRIQVTCVDAVAKKAAFVQQVAASLGLPHLRGLHQRIEHIHTPHDLVCSRAFASLSDFVKGSARALAPGGVWLALKGKSPDDEVSQLNAGAQVFHVEQLLVPGLDAQRCLVWMRSATP